VILVAGGTGRLGRLVATELAASGHEVRVLSRGLRAPAPGADPGIEVVVGDVRDPAAVAEAMQGVTLVVSAVQGFAGPGRLSPASVDRDGNAVLVAAAAAAGAHVVLTSVLGASPDHPIELFRMKAAAEEALRASGTPWTIVRAGAFLELHEELMRRTAGRSGRPLVFGRGDTPVVFASVADVAAAVDRALVDPACRGAVLEVATATLTFNQLAAGLVADLGPAAGRPRHVPRPVLRLMAGAGSTPPGRQAAAALVMDGVGVPA
jgi:NADH dehydrogenase